MVIVNNRLTKNAGPGLLCGVNQPPRPALAALILEWLVNGHGARFILGLAPLI